MTDKLLLGLGGEDTLAQAVDHWYARVLQDPMLVPLFGAGDPAHVEHLTAFLVEVFGGPTRYTDDLGGFSTLLASHRGLAIEEAQRRRFIELFMSSFDTVAPTAERSVRAELASYLEFGTEVAVVNSHAEGEEDLHPCQVVPTWP